MNGAIVCLGIRHGIASLIVVDGEMVVCMCPAVFSCLADRVYGIAPMVDATLCLGGCIQWCRELQESGFREILSINPDNLPEALAMQHDIAMENVRRTGKEDWSWYPVTQA